MPTNRFNTCLTYGVWITLIVVMPSVSFAAGDAVTSIIYNLTHWLSGTVARAVAVLAIISLGFLCLSGHISKRLVFSSLIGMGLIFGGSYVAESILLPGVL
jgi:type IV secretion system protein VirB2